jgi:hypothetical protein
MKFIISIVLSVLIVLNFPLSSQADAISIAKSDVRDLLTTVLENAASNSLTIEDIKQKYPNANIKQVSVNEYQNYKREFAQNSIEIKNYGLPVEKAKTESLPVKTTYKSTNPCGFDPDRKNSDYRSNVTNTESHGVWNLNSYSGSGSSKDALVVIVVVGVVVVAALVIYSMVYLYNMSARGFECRIWNDSGLRYSNINDHSTAQDRNGNLTGVFFTTGYRVPYGMIGITGELGQHSIDLKINKNSINKSYNGAYFLVGPSFLIPFDELNGHNFQIELLAGTSTEKQIGFMSTLRFGAGIKLASNFSLGLNLGAALVNIKGFDNYLTDQDHLNYLSGFDMSFRW